MTWLRKYRQLRARVNLLRALGRVERTHSLPFGSLDLFFEAVMQVARRKA